MVHDRKSIGAYVLRLIVALVLLGSARMGVAEGTWSVVSLPRQPGQVLAPTAVTADAAGNVYVVDLLNGGQLQSRDTLGNWSVLAANGTGPGQVNRPAALTVDSAGNLYVLDWLYLNGTSDSVARIQKRDAQGNWSTIATGYSAAVGRVQYATALAVDAAGNLYVADYDGVNGNGRIQKRDTQGAWSVLATGGTGTGQLNTPWALAVDATGNLYVAEPQIYSASRIQKRDAQGNWSVVITYGTATGQFIFPHALAVDTAGTLYVAEGTFGTSGGTIDSRIQRRDAQGNWSTLAAHGTALGQVHSTWAPFPNLAVDPNNNLYVADTGNDRIEQRDTAARWSLVPTTLGGPGQVAAPGAVATDPAGNLYVADSASGGRIQKRDTQGKWSVIATGIAAYALAADGGSNLYIADGGTKRLLMRTPQGNWYVGATYGSPGQIPALASDAAGNVYVSDIGNRRILLWDVVGNWYVVSSGGTNYGLALDPKGYLYGAQPWDIEWQGQRDSQGSWSVIATSGTGLGQVAGAAALAVDAAGNLYVADPGDGKGRIQKRDAQGNWSALTTAGAELGQVNRPAGLAAGPAGSLYVADSGNNRVLLYTPRP